MATVILENVNAHFPIYGAQQRSLRKTIFDRATGGSIEREGKKNDRVTVKALSDISLTLHDGDRIGLVGHNGAGKSTLLKVMAGIYQPVSGTIKVEGRVTPLFDALPGLDGEDTGYENIITAGMLIGMTREQVEAKIPEIEEFCELGEYLALPVRTYSSGMTMRLGFALVTALDPGVLLMDEVIGTGDQRFAERAEERMEEFIGRSRIMVLASHSETTIRTMCNKALILNAGRIAAFGPVNEICDQYRDSVRAAATRARRITQSEPAVAVEPSIGGAQPEPKNEQPDEAGRLELVQPAEAEEVWHSVEFNLPDRNVKVSIERSDEVVCLGGSVETEDGLPAAFLAIERPIYIKLRYRVLKDLTFPLIPNFHFRDESNELVFISTPEELPPSNVGEYCVTCVVPPFQLNNGRYRVNPAISSFSGQPPLHFFVIDALRFEVVEDDPSVDARRHGWSLPFPGVSRPRLAWSSQRLGK